MAAGGKQVYDRSALKLTEQQIKDYENDGRFSFLHSESLYKSDL